MGNSTSELIKKEAHLLEMKVEGKTIKRYFLTPGELYNQISSLDWVSITSILKELDGTLALLDIDKDIVIQLGDGGYIVARYSQLVSPEDKLRIEEILNKRRNFLYA